MVNGQELFLLSMHVSTCDEYFSQSPGHSLHLQNLEENKEYSWIKIYLFALNQIILENTGCLSWPTENLQWKKAFIMSCFLSCWIADQTSSCVFFYLGSFLLWWEKRSLHLVQMQQLAKTFRSCYWPWLFAVILLFHIPLPLIVMYLSTFF